MKAEKPRKKFNFCTFEYHQKALAEKDIHIKQLEDSLELAKNAELKSHSRDFWKAEAIRLKSEKDRIPFEKRSSNPKSFCTECFKIVNVKKHCFFWGDDCGLDSITHKKPCGDELNSDISVVKPLTIENLLEAGKNRRSFYKSLFIEAGNDCDYAIKRLGIDLLDFRKLRRPHLYKKEALEAIEKKIKSKWGIGERKGVIPFKDTPFGSELIKAVMERLKELKSEPCSICCKCKIVWDGLCNSCEECKSDAIDSFVNYEDVLEFEKAVLELLKVESPSLEKKRLLTRKKTDKVEYEDDDYDPAAGEYHGD